MKVKNVRLHLQRYYGLMIGERTAEEIKQKFLEFERKKVRVVGRSLETGKRKTIHIPFKKLL